MSGYLKEPLETYLQKLAARLPCPGGGSVAALTTALSAALVSMVANYTLGKKAYQQYEQEITDILRRADMIRQKTEKYVEEDSRIYEKIQQATREKSPHLITYLKQSASLHLEIAKECLSLLQVNLVLLEKGNRHLISDVGISAVLAEAGFRAAALNAAINFKYITDTSFVTAGQTDLNNVKAQVMSLSTSIEQQVNQLLT